MISAVNNSPNFTGIVPIRVFVDGHETFDQKVVKSATRQLTSALMKPKENKHLTDTFAKVDTEYLKKDFKLMKYPSDYFRFITSEHYDYFLATGKETDYIKTLGRKIGFEKRNCLEQGVQESRPLEYAKKEYSGVISRMVSSDSLRMKDKKSNNPVTLIIDMISNGKYGFSDFKMKLKDIQFILNK